MKAVLPRSEKDKEVKVALPDICDRQQVHIINPMSGRDAGRGNIYAAVEKSVAENGGQIIKSEHPGHIEEIVRETCAKDPFVHIVAYGGDGTVYEVINGIMNADAGCTASFSIVPVGSGNDFSAYVNDSGVFRKSELNKIDVIRTRSGGNTRYFVNMMNIGFDCDVVRATYSLKKKPLFKGSTAYLAGVAKTLILKKPLRVKVTVEGIEPFEFEKNEKFTSTEVFEQEMLLTATANARYCGGGFCAAPLANLTDGLMDVLVVNNMSRRKFISLVGAYKAGTYIDENGKMPRRYSEILTYRKCRKITIEGAAAYCLDGEVCMTDQDRTVEAEIVPGALWYAAL